MKYNSIKLRVKIKSSSSSSSRMRITNADVYGTVVITTAIARVQGVDGMNRDTAADGG